MNEKIIKKPLTDTIKYSIENCKERLYFAVPYLSSFAITLLNKHKISKIKDKRLITCFEDSSLFTFDLPTLEKLLDFGFTIQFDNSIHLKLYITDADAYVSSSNLTESGFEKNVELTVKTESNNVNECIDVFMEIWRNCSENKVTYELIKNNLEKYKNLRKMRHPSVKTKPVKLGTYDLQEIIDKIISKEDDYPRINKLAIKANYIREKIKEELLKKFDSLIFYAPEGHDRRRENLFYHFVYGTEKDLAGTGLFEYQFKTVFENQMFEKVVEYLFPEIIGKKSLNLSDKNEFINFCNKIFDFKIPQYSETIPIRLASYFYPDNFLPIFKLEHLKKISESFGIETDAKTPGEKLFAYNSFLLNYIKMSPYNNYIKSNICYRTYFTVELYNKLKKGETYENILKSFKQRWEKDMIKEGMNLLNELNIN